MPRTNHTHLPGAVNHAHYALPTTSYLYKLNAGRVDSSSSDVGHTARNKSPRKKRLESEQSTTDKLDQSDVTLDVSARDDGTESEELVKQLQTDFDDLLSKYAMAEVTIDQLRLGAKLNMYADPALPSHAAVVQPSTARSANTLTLPQRGQASLNSSLQSAVFSQAYPGLSPRQTDSGILTAASPNRPLTEEQRALTDNIAHLQDQVGSFVAGISGEGSILNLKPEIHHQLFEALEQSQDTLHHQLIEEKRADPTFDLENQLAGQLHQVRMSMDEHADRLPPLEQPSRSNNKYTSDDDTLSQTPSSVATGNSGSSGARRSKRSHRHSKRGSRQGTSQGSRPTPSYTDRSSSVEDMLTDDDDTVRPGAHPRSKDLSPPNMKPQSRVAHGAASSSSVGGSDHTQGVKSRTRLQGSSDSGFIGSEEGKSPNTPSDRHLSGLPTIQSQAENSGIDSPRALTPDLSESRTAEWALRHKVPVEVESAPVLPEPPNAKRAQSRSSRKSVRSERSGQSSLKSEALRSMKSEIDRLRDDFNLHQQTLPSAARTSSVNIPRQTFGSPLKATYQPPPGYPSHSPLRAQASNKTDGRNSDLDLSEAEGARGLTPASPTREEYYPSADEDPRQPINKPETGKSQQPPSMQTMSRQPFYSYRDPQHPSSQAREPEYLPSKTKESQYSPSRPREHRRSHSGKPTPRGAEDRPADSPLQGYIPPPEGRRRSGANSPASFYETRSAEKSSYPKLERPVAEYRHADRTYPQYRERLDEPDHRLTGAERVPHRDEVPMSRHAYTDPEREYYRRYKSPVRQTHRDDPRSRSFDQTMDELNTRDLHQATAPLDSTVYTHHNGTPNIAPPNAMSTPYHHTLGSQPQALRHAPDQSRQPSQQTHSHPPTYTHQPTFPSHPQTGSMLPLQQHPVTSLPHQQHPVTSLPHQQHPVTSLSYQQYPVTSLPAHHHTVTSLPLQQNIPVQQALVQTVPVAYETCPSCSGKGMLATAHSCAMCGSQLSSTHSLTSANHVASPSLAVANQNAPVVIPIANQKSSQAYLTQQTTQGYLTQSVNVVDSVDTSSRSQPDVAAMPVLESSPSGKVRYYVKEYGAIPSDTEPRRSKSQSRRRRSKSSDRYRDYSASESVDDLESSLREARRSAESLKRLSRGMRDSLHTELLRSLNRKSLTSSWNF